MLISTVQEISCPCPVPSQRKRESSRKPGRREELTQCPVFPAWVRDGLLWKPLFLCWLRPRSIHKREPGLAQPPMGRGWPCIQRCLAHGTPLRLHIPLSPEPVLGVGVVIRNRPLSCLDLRSWQNHSYYPPKISERAEVSLSVLQAAHVPRRVPTPGSMCLSLIILPTTFIYSIFIFI